MFCKNCGSQMNDDATFCFNCGWSNTLIEEKNKQRNANIQNKAFLILGIAVSIIAFILLAILNFRKDGWQGDYYYKNGEKLKNSWVGDYYVGEDGKYVKNAWAKYENDWYYCGSDGKIVKNNWVDNQNYYVDGSGKMLKNTMTPDGYYVGEDGKYINNNSIKSSGNSENKNFEELVAIYNENTVWASLANFYGSEYRKFDSDGKLWMWNESLFGQSPCFRTYTIYTTKDDYVIYKWTHYYVNDLRQDDGSKYYKNNNEISENEFFEIEDKFENMVDCYDKFLKNN